MFLTLQEAGKNNAVQGSNSLISNYNAEITEILYENEHSSCFLWKLPGLPLLKT